MLKSTLLAAVVTAALITPAMAEETTSAMASPGCNADKIKELGGDAVSKVEKGAWEGGYNVTLDTGKLTYADLTKKMMDAGCFAALTK